MKDARGHGSNGRGQSVGKVIPARPATQSDFGRGAFSAGDPQDQGVIDGLARRALGNGHPKSEPVPVHAGAAGRSDEANSYNRELGLRLRNTGRNGRLPPTSH